MVGWEFGCGGRGRDLGTRGFCFVGLGFAGFCCCFIGNTGLVMAVAGAFVDLEPTMNILFNRDIDRSRNRTHPEAYRPT